MTQLCDYCQTIPESFFIGKSLSDDIRIQYIMENQWPHLPIDALRRSAEEGCSLCRILAAGIQSDWLPPEINATRRTTLRLALIDPQQGFQICVDMDDVNHVLYYHVPSSQSMVI